MKIIAFQDKHRLIASLSVAELLNFAGFHVSVDFNKFVEAPQATLYGNTLSDGQCELLEREIPVSDIYKDAKETLEAYAELTTKLESVRNQLTILTNKMKPKEEEAHG